MGFGMFVFGLSLVMLGAIGIERALHNDILAFSCFALAFGTILGAGGLAHRAVYFRKH